MTDKQCDWTCPTEDCGKRCGVVMKDGKKQFGEGEMKKWLI